MSADTINDKAKISLLITVNRLSYYCHDKTNALVSYGTAMQEPDNRHNDFLSSQHAHANKT